jgi:hypothetical protein
MMQIQTRRDFSKLGLAAREEAAEQPTLAQPLQPGRPAVGRASQSLKNPGEFCRDPGLLVTKEASRKVDQKQIVSQRNIRGPSPHAKSPDRVDLRSDKARAIPRDRRRRESPPRCPAGPWRGPGYGPGPSVFHALFDRSVVAVFGGFGETGRDRVQIDVDGDGQEGFFIEDSNALGTSLEKNASHFVLPIGESSERLLQAFHKPTQALNRSRAVATHLV